MLDFHNSYLFFRTTGGLCFRRSHWCCKIMFNLGANYECLYRCQKCCILLLQTCHSVFGRFRFVSTWRYQNSNQAVFDRYFKKSKIFGVQSIPFAWDWFLWGTLIRIYIFFLLKKLLGEARGLAFYLLVNWLVVLNLLGYLGILFKLI